MDQAQLSSDVNGILWSIFRPAFPLLLLIGVVWVLQQIGPDLWSLYVQKRNFKRGSKWLSDRDLISWLRGMNPAEFEEYISLLFKALGYTTTLNGGPHDGGIDVIAEKDGVKHYIQCKKFITSEVGVSAVRDFYGAMAGRAALGKGFFITTNKFSLDAERFAEDKPIELIDSLKLARYIRMAEGQGFLAKPTGVIGRKCQECGGMLIERISKFGKFLGCENFPRCKHTEKI